jgi:D-alanyl-D-alanine carboxypeptidase
MRRRVFMVLSAVVVTALAASVLPAAATRGRGAAFPPAVHRRIDLVAERPEVLGVPGSVVAVTVPGKGSYVNARGHASLNPDVQLTTDTHFRVGSITKTFTATVVLQLIEEGKLGLDDPLGTYVPDAPNADLATVRDLLDMTSGIFDEGGPGSDLSTQSGSDPAKCWTPEEIVALAKQQGPGAPLGTYYYSDTNYVLLGMIVEKVTGATYGDQLKTRILDKLGLHETVYPDPCSTAIPEPAATGYLVQLEQLTGPNGPRYQREKLPPPSPSTLGPAGAIISTVGDLQTWAKALATGKLLDKATQRERLAAITRSPVIGTFTPLAGVDLPVTRGLPVRYGLGIADAGSFLGHNGAANGFLAEMWYQPSTGATIVVLINASVVSGADLASAQLVDVPDFMFSSIAQIVVPKSVKTTNA